MARRSRMRWQGFGEQTRTGVTTRAVNARHVDCPACGRVAGQHCRDENGIPMPTVHDERIVAAAKTAAISIASQQRAVTRRRTGEKPITDKQAKFLRQLRQAAGRDTAGINALTLAQAKDEIDVLVAAKR